MSYLFQYDDEEEEECCLSFLELIQEEEASLGMLYSLENTRLRAIANFRWNLLTEFQKEQYRKMAKLGLDSKPEDEYSKLEELTIFEKTHPLAVARRLSYNYNPNRKVTRTTSPLRMPSFSELLKPFIH